MSVTVPSARGPRQPGQSSARQTPAKTTAGRGRRTTLARALAIFSDDADVLEWWGDSAEHRLNHTTPARGTGKPPPRRSNRQCTTETGSPSRDAVTIIVDLRLHVSPCPRWAPAQLSEAVMSRPIRQGAGRRRTVQRHAARLRSPGRARRGQRGGREEVHGGPPQGEGREGEDRPRSRNWASSRRSRRRSSPTRCRTSTRRSRTRTPGFARPRPQCLGKCDEPYDKAVPLLVKCSRTTRRTSR